jgi:hypothetical protein
MVVVNPALEEASVVLVVKYDVDNEVVTPKFELEVEGFVDELELAPELVVELVPETDKKHFI